MKDMITQILLALVAFLAGCLVWTILASNSSIIVAGSEQLDDSVLMSASMYACNAGDSSLRLIITPADERKLLAVNFKVTRISFYSDKHKRFLFLDNNCFGMYSNTVFKDIDPVNQYSHYMISNKSPAIFNTTALASGQFIIECDIIISCSNDRVANITLNRAVITIHPGLPSENQTAKYDSIFYSKDKVRRIFDEIERKVQ